MSTLSTQAVRKVVTHGWEEALTLEEWTLLLEARRDQILPLMKWLDTLALRDLEIKPYADKVKVGVAPIDCADPLFDAKERNLYFYKSGGSGEWSTHLGWGLTRSGKWLTFRINVQDFDVIKSVDVAVFETQDFLSEIKGVEIWITLSEVIRLWVRRRKKLYQKAKKVRKDFSKQDALVAPLIEVTASYIEEFVHENT